MKNKINENIITDDIKILLDKFTNGTGKNKGRKPDERYASFDFCYNYFYSFYKDKDKNIKDLANDENIQMSCLQLGFYLASWGMMRGSSFLLEKSVRNFRDLIIAISKMDSKLWEIDVDKYTEENIKLLLPCKQQIVEVLGIYNKPSDTLVTKIMLGIFANVPAYDDNFKKFLKNVNYCQTFSEKSLLQIKDFYNNNKIFDSYKKIRTFDFLTAKETHIFYTKAKLIDMYGFEKGKEINGKEKQRKKSK
jgi:hypothetical protein